MARISDTDPGISRAVPKKSSCASLDFKSSFVVSLSGMARIKKMMMPAKPPKGRLM